MYKNSENIKIKGNDNINNSYNNNTITNNFYVNGEIYVDKDFLNNIDKISVGILQNPNTSFIPVKITTKDNSFCIDYLELNIEKIKNDIIYLNNKNRAYRGVIIEFFINKNDLTTEKMNIYIKDDFKTKVESHIVYNEILLNLKNKNMDKIMDLREGNELFLFKKVKMKSNNLEDKLAFFKKIKDIQAYYKVNFVIPEKIITDDDYFNIHILENAMIEKPIIRGIEGDLIYKEKDREVVVDILKTFNSRKGVLIDKSKDRIVELFGEKIVFKEKIVFFKNMIVTDTENILKEYRQSNKNKEIKLKFIADEKKGAMVEYYSLKEHDKEYTTYLLNKKDDWV